MTAEQTNIFMRWQHQIMMAQYYGAQGTDWYNHFQEASNNAIYLQCEFERTLAPVQRQE